MAYENISNNGKAGSGGTNPGDNPGIDELVYKVLTPMRPFITDGSDAITFFGTMEFYANDTTDPGATIYTSNFDGPSSDILWWRGISGTPGGFSNYRMVEDKYGTHFEATWDGLTGKPDYPISILGAIEYLAIENKTADYHKE